MLSTSDSPQDAAGKLVRMALERGGKDNVTIITAFIQAEETAIFATRAAAMVGDTDADYEEEYRNSYGSNQTEGEEATSPYANADARAYIKPTDKVKVLKIAGIVAAVALVLVAAALVIKTVVKGKNEQETTFPLITEEIRTYTYPSTAPIDIWSELPTEESTSQTGPKTERSTRRHTTTRRANRTTNHPQAYKSRNKADDGAAFDRPRDRGNHRRSYRACNSARNGAGDQAERSACFGKPAGYRAAGNSQ